MKLFAQDLAVEAGEYDAERLQGAKWVFVVEGKLVVIHTSKLRHNIVGCSEGMEQHTAIYSLFLSFELTTTDWKMKITLGLCKCKRRLLHRSVALRSAVMALAINSTS